MNKEIQRLKNQIANFNTKDYDGVVNSLDGLLDKLKSFQMVLDTLDMFEYRLICYLRCCPVGSVYRFMRLAEDLSKVNDKINALSSPEPDIVLVRNGD